MSKDDGTWLKVAYVAVFFLLAYTLTRAGNTLGVQTGWIEQYDQWFGIAVTMASLVLGAAGVWWLAANAERRAFHLEAIGELRKVTFPTPLDTRRMTVIVVIVVGIFAAILWVFDLAWSTALRQIMPQR